MTSGPPHASSWATPPEFYADENVVTKSVRRLLSGLGYTIHTPWELYGSRYEAQGAPDEDWLGRVSQRGWAVLNRDAKIYERPSELEAYRRARVQVFLLPGEARAAELAQLVANCLREMCTIASSRDPGTWRLTEKGVVQYEIPADRRRRRLAR